MLPRGPPNIVRFFLPALDAISTKKSRRTGLAWTHERTRSVTGSCHKSVAPISIHHQAHAPVQPSPAVSNPEGSRAVSSHCCSDSYCPKSPDRSDHHATITHTESQSPRRPPSRARPPSSTAKESEGRRPSRSPPSLNDKERRSPVAVLGAYRQGIKEGSCS